MVRKEITGTDDSGKMLPWKAAELLATSGHESNTWDSILRGSGDHNNKALVRIARGTTPRLFSTMYAQVRIEEGLPSLPDL